MQVEYIEMVWNIPPWGSNPREYVENPNLSTIDGKTVDLRHINGRYQVIVAGSTISDTDDLSATATAMNRYRVCKVRPK